LKPEINITLLSSFARFPKKCRFLEEFPRSARLPSW